LYVFEQCDSHDCLSLSYRLQSVTRAGKAAFRLSGTPEKGVEMIVPAICIPLLGIGMSEWLVIILVVALLFGGSKLPKLGKGLGEGIRNFKKGITGDLDNEKLSSDESKTEKSTELSTTTDKDA
jgi:sec-independent protein translocase protein TatA